MEQRQIELLKEIKAKLTTLGLNGKLNLIDGPWRIQLSPSSFDGTGALIEELLSGWNEQTIQPAFEDGDIIQVGVYAPKFVNPRFAQPPKVVVFDREGNSKAFYIKAYETEAEKNVEPTDRQKELLKQLQADFAELIKVGKMNCFHSQTVTLKAGDLDGAAEKIKELLTGWGPQSHYDFMPEGTICYVGVYVPNWDDPDALPGQPQFMVYNQNEASASFYAE